MIHNILKGIKSYGRAFAFISKLKLWSYLVIPILVAIFIFCITFIPMWFIYSISKGFLSFWESDTANTVFFEISHYIEIIVFFIVGKIIYKHIAMAILSPLMSPLSLKIETHLYDNKHKHIELSFMNSLMRGLRINTRNFIREMLITLVLFMLSSIASLSIVSVFLLFLLHAYYAGFGNMDPTLERHFNYKNSIRFVKKNRGIAIGNGIVFLLCLFIPLVGLIIAYPISFLAASVATLEALDEPETALNIE